MKTMKHNLKGFSALLAGIFAMCCLVACEEEPKEQPFTYDTVELDTVLNLSVKGDSAHATFKWKLDYPTNGDSLLCRYLRQRAALLVDVCSRFSITPEGSETFTGMDTIYVMSHTISKNNIMNGKGVLRDATTSFFSCWQKDMEDMGAIDYEENGELTILMQTPRFLTTRSQVYTYAGGAHGSTVFEYATYDKQAYRQLGYKDLLKPEATTLLQDVLAEGLRKFWDLKTVEDVNNELMDAKLGEIPLPLGTPGLTPEGLALQYQQYEICCYASGAPLISIPYAQVDTLLTPLGKELLQSMQAPEQK